MKMQNFKFAELLFVDRKHSGLYFLQRGIIFLGKEIFYFKNLL